MTSTITKKKWISSYVRMDNIEALSYLMKMGMMGWAAQKARNWSPSWIYDYLLIHKITITAEYLSKVFNVQVSRESRNLKNLSK